MDRVNEDQPDVSTVIDIHRISRENGFQDVADKAWELMLDRFQDVTQTDAFKDLTEIELKEYLQDDRLNVANEDPVFEAMVTWVRHDSATREARFESIMGNVKLSHCSLDFLRYAVWQEPLMKLGDCYDHLLEAVFRHAPDTSLQPETARKGYAARIKPLIVVGSEGWELEDGESNWRVNSKYSLPSGITDAEWYSACITKDGIVVTGGRSHINNTKITQCWKLSLETLSWSALPGLTQCEALLSCFSGMGKWGLCVWRMAYTW